MTMITVKATREGLVGRKTSLGFKIDTDTPFIALPSPEALRQWAWVRNAKTGKWCHALVLDVGPWFEHDNAYVFQPATWGEDVPVETHIRPAAEKGVDAFGRTTNGAGIDLSEKVWNLLGMTDNTEVSWMFALPAPPAAFTFGRELK